MNRSVTGWWLTLALVACGGPGTGPVPRDVAEDLCRDTCEYDQSCGRNSVTVDECTAGCVDAVTGTYREDAFTAIVECALDLPCGESADACFSRCEPTASHERFEARCRTRVAECGVPPTDIDEACAVTPGVGLNGSYFCVLVPAVMDDLRACYDEPDCGGISSCFDRVLEAHGLE